MRFFGNDVKPREGKTKRNKENNVKSAKGFKTNELIPLVPLC